MGLNTSCFFVQLLILAMGCLSSRAQRTEWTFPECAADARTCGPLGCREVPISFSRNVGYSPHNVICIDNNSPASYLLTRCPNGFFNTFQSTSGICTITTDDNGTDLLLRANELVPGLHSFRCLVNNSNNVVTSAIIANDDSPYRDMLVYINSILQHHVNTNVTLDQDDNLTIVVRGVGNISTINATDPRFICETDFACNMQLSLSDVSNRGVKCSLHTPAELSDNGRTLSVLVDNMEQINITIIVNERPLWPPSPSVVPAAATTSADAHLQPTTGHSTNVEPTTTSVGTTNLPSSIVQTSSMGQAFPSISPSDKGSEGVPSGVRTAIIVVAVVVVVAIIILIVVGIIVCIRKNKLSVCKKEDTARHTEEARGAPPITCSRSSSLRRNSITSADGQLPSTWLKDLKDKIEYNIEITEEVNTGVHALNTDNTKSLKRQTSAS